VDESSFEQVKPFQHFQYSSKLIVEWWNFKVILCIFTDIKSKNW
jgi:hypothetical protein